jgi:5-methylcytosine-specific restriction endonuclease McrA
LIGTPTRIGLYFTTSAMSLDDRLAACTSEEQGQKLNSTCRPFRRARTPDIILPMRCQKRTIAILCCLLFAIPVLGSRTSSSNRPRSSRGSSVGRSRSTVGRSRVSSPIRSSSTRSSHFSGVRRPTASTSRSSGSVRSASPQMSRTPHISSQRTQHRTSTPRVPRPAASSATKCASCNRNSVGRIARSSVAKSSFQRQHPCPSTGRTSGACPGYVVDHVIPLKRGGADAAVNMQWQTIAAAKAKDKIE